LGLAEIQAAPLFHLHFEIRVQIYGLNPAIFFNFENHAATQDTLTLLWSSSKQN
jgi:hypothetical protein